MSNIAEMAARLAPQMLRRAFCSQCGREFDSRPHGFSECRNHRHLRRNPRYLPTLTDSAYDAAEHIVDTDPAEVADLFCRPDLLPEETPGVADMGLLETLLLIRCHRRAGRHDLAREIDNELQEQLIRAVGYELAQQAEGHL